MIIKIIKIYKIVLVIYSFSYLFFCQPIIGNAKKLPNKIIALHYTGSTWAPALWSNLNIHQVAKDFIEIKSNGFNTIILIVPWVGFQTSIKPITYSESYFQILTHIFRAARHIDLKVILRIGYAHEIGENSTPGHNSRKERVLTDGVVFNAWKDYLNRIYQTTKQFDNFLFAFLTWEDFFLLNYTTMDDEKRCAISKTLGFNDYIKRYPLSLLSGWYRKEFKNYSQIPLPKHNSPIIFLFFEFWDQYLLKLHEKSRAVFPGMSLEVRVDCDPDPVHSGYICHEDTYDIGNNDDKTLIYFTPTWGAKNIGNADSADVVLKRFEYLIQKIKEETDNFIFIDRFNFVDNTPEFYSNTVLLKEELPDFIAKSFDIIDRNTIGYALWSLKDVPMSCIANGSFERGALGWKINNGDINYDIPNKEHRIRLNENGYIVQEFNLNRFINPAKGTNLPFTLRFDSGLSSGLTGILKIEITDNYNNKVVEQQITIDHIIDDNKPTVMVVPNCPTLKKGRLKFYCLENGVILDNIELYHKSLKGGMYDEFGNPKRYKDSIIRLNNKLSSVTQ